MIIVATILAIARLSIYRMIKSRAFVWQLIIVAGIAAGLPFALQSGPSPGNTLTLVVTYVPPLIFAILLIGSIWGGASLSAQDIDEGTFAAIHVKPTPLIAVWLGKWLALLGLNAFLLMTAGVLLRTVIMILDDRLPQANTDQLDGHAVFSPTDAVLREATHARRVAIQLTGQPAPPFKTLLNTVKAEAFRVPPGKSHAWTIPVDGMQASLRHSPRILRYHFFCSAVERQPISGIWRIESDADTTQFAVTNQLDGQHERALSPQAQTLLSSSKASPQVRLQPSTIRVAFSNHIDSAATAFFNPIAPVSLLVRQHSFSVNLLRAGILIFCFVGTASAVSLTFGSLFSFPIAVYSAICLLLALLLGTLFATIAPSEHNHEQIAAESQNIITATGEWLLITVHKATASILERLPLKALAEARAITGSSIRHGVITLLIIIPALLCLVSVAHLSRREFM